MRPQLPAAERAAALIKVRVTSKQKRQYVKAAKPDGLSAWVRTILDRACKGGAK